MKKLKSQWIKGWELLKPREGDVQSKIQYLEDYYKVHLPSSLINYLTKYQPFDIYDYSNYEVEVFFWEQGTLVIHTNKKIWGDIYPISHIYDLDEILAVLMTDENCNLGCYQRTLKVFPIASNGSPYGDIIISLAENTLGRVYTLVDYQDSEVNESTLITNSIDEFISNLEVLPEEEARKMGNP
jgi:hypothetical protein